MEPGNTTAQHLLQSCGSGGLSDHPSLSSACKLPARALQPEVGGTDTASYPPQPQLCVQKQLWHRGTRYQRDVHHLQCPDPNQRARSHQERNKSTQNISPGRESLLYKLHSTTVTPFLRGVPAAGTACAPATGAPPSRAVCTCHQHELVPPSGFNLSLQRANPSLLPTSQGYVTETRNKTKQNKKCHMAERSQAASECWQHSETTARRISKIINSSSSESSNHVLLLAVLGSPRSSGVFTEGNGCDGNQGHRVHKCPHRDLGMVRRWQGAGQASICASLPEQLLKIVLQTCENF